MRLADMDGDGDLDVIVAGDSNGRGFSWYENTGSYHVNIMAREQIDAPDPAPTAIDAGDLDNDGDLDFVGSTANYIGYSRVKITLLVGMRMMELLIRPGQIQLLKQKTVMLSSKK